MIDKSLPQKSLFQKYPTFFYDVFGLWLISSSILTVYFGVDMAIAYIGFFIFFGIVTGIVIVSINGIQKGSISDRGMSIDVAGQKRLALFEAFFGNSKLARVIFTIIWFLMVLFMWMIAFSKEGVPLP
jgi:hypothetical protein